jgi:hypothetical protein
MIPDGAVELIYACHVLEYFDISEAVVVLTEWRKKLQFGGTLRLSVPDFAALAEVYRISGDLERVMGPLYGKWRIKGTDEIRYHRSIYDFSSLSTLLRSSNYGNIRRYNWKSTIHKDFDDYSQSYFPHMDKINGLAISINIEADKCENELNADI